MVHMQTRRPVLPWVVWGVALFAYTVAVVNRLFAFGSVEVVPGVAAAR